MSVLRFDEEKRILRPIAPNEGRGSQLLMGLVELLSSGAIDPESMRQHRYVSRNLEYTNATNPTNGPKCKGDVIALFRSFTWALAKLKVKVKVISSNHFECRAAYSITGVQDYTFYDKDKEIELEPSGCQVRFDETAVFVFDEEEKLSKIRIVHGVVGGKVASLVRQVGPSSLGRQYVELCQQSSVEPHSKALAEFRRMDQSGDLSVYDIRHNPIGDNAIAPVITTLGKNLDLCHVFLRKCNLSNTAVEILAQHFRNHPSLEEVDVSENPRITNTSLNALLVFTSTVPLLTKLNLKETGLKRTERAKVEVALSGSGLALEDEAGG